MHPVEGRQKSGERPQKRKNGNNKKRGTREEMGKTSLRAIGRLRWTGWKEQVIYWRRGAPQRREEEEGKNTARSSLWKAARKF